jgi:polyisoprenoid-binding protein YceI
MPNRIVSRIAALLLCLAPAGAFAQDTAYAIDPVHTRVMFAVSHAGFSNPMGTISGSTGTFVFDPADWSSARVEAKIPLDRLELGDAKWNEAVLGRSFLDAKQHPVATFVSTRIEPVDATHATLFGNLTLRGVTREVKLDLVFHQAKRHPMPPFRRTAGFSATGKLSRKAFAITAWQSVVGDDVELRIEAEGTRMRGDAEDVAPATTTTPAAATSTTMPAPATTAMPAAPTSVAPASDTTTPP